MGLIQGERGKVKESFVEPSFPTSEPLQAIGFSCHDWISEDIVE